MRDPETQIPDRDAIKMQLSRMLASPIFKNATSQAPLLNIIIDLALRGIQPTEAVIGKAWLGRKYHKDETTNVRVVARSMRKTIRLYYETIGAHDPIVISFAKPPKDKRIKLPAGEAYRPHFSTNPQFNVSLILQDANTLLREMLRPDDAMFSAMKFRMVSELQPANIDALIGMAKANCVCSLFFEEPHSLLERAHQLFLNASTIEPDHPAPYVGLGTVHTLLGQLSDAEPFFMKAHQLNPTFIHKQVGFRLFFHLRSDFQNHIPRFHVEGGESELLADALRNLFFYLGGKTEYLRNHGGVFEYGVQDHWLNALVRVFVALDSAEELLLKQAYIALDKILGPGVIQERFIGLSYLSGRAGFGPVARYSDRDLGAFTDNGEQGLFDKSVPYFQRALVALACDNPAAWALFEKALQNKEPMILLVEYLHFLKPWRGSQEFKRLVKMIRFDMDKPKP